MQIFPRPPSGPDVGNMAAMTKIWSGTAPTSKSHNAIKNGTCPLQAVWNETLKPNETNKTIPGNIPVTKSEILD